jgi:hypothetical protein
VPYVDKVKSVKKNTGVSQPRWAIWCEIWKLSYLPSLLYCISRKTVDTEYTYFSWCMTSTDIVKWRKTNDYENFEKGMIYMKILGKRGGSREKGGGGNEIHAPCACDLFPLFADFILSFYLWCVFGCFFMCFGVFFLCFWVLWGVLG